MKQVTVDNLTKKEKEAINKFLSESCLLYESVGAGITFAAFLTILAEGLHDAFKEQNRKKRTCP